MVVATDIKTGNFQYTIIELDNGEVMAINTASYSAAYDTYTETGVSGGVDDGEVFIQYLYDNPDTFDVNILYDSSGGSFTADYGGSRWIYLTRDNGEVIKIDPKTAYFNSSDLLDGSTDGKSDVDLISSNANSTHQVFYSSTGQNFTVSPTSAQGSSVEQIKFTGGATYLVNNTRGIDALDGASDYRMDVDFISDGTYSGAYEVVNTDGNDFDIAYGDQASAIVSVDNGDVFRFTLSNITDLGRLDNIDGATDKTIDIAEFDNYTDTRGIFKFEDTSNQSFSVTSGGFDELLIAREDGSVIRIVDSELNRYDKYSTTGLNNGANDGVIDINALDANLDARYNLKFIDSTGGTFTIEPAHTGVNGDHGDLLVTMGNGATYVINGNNTGLSSYDTLDGVDDGIIDVSLLDANINTLGIYRFTPCFARGTLITTSRGAVPIEMLSIGDSVKTMDHGVQKIRWIGSTTVSATGDFAPVVFTKGSLGNSRELVVSPQHRMLLTGWKAELLFGKSQVLSAATHLVNGDTIYRREGGVIEYFHMMFDTHEIIWGEGIPTESFYPGQSVMDNLGMETQDEILKLFPELRKNVSSYGPTCRICLKGYECQAYVSYIGSPTF